jgi:hypothetical protein
MTCRDVFKVNQVPHHVRCRWKGLVKSIPTMHEIRPLWTFAKRWHKKFTKRSYNVSKTLTQRFQNVDPTFPKRWHNVSKKLTQRFQNVDTAFTKRYWSCSETVPPLGYTRLNGLFYQGLGWNPNPPRNAHIFTNLTANIVYHCLTCWIMQLDFDLYKKKRPFHHIYP